MSLVVWLPLNGNVNNQGLSEYTFSSGNTTVSADGKIGKCYNFAQTTGNGIYSADNGFMSKYINNKSWSMGGWYRSTATGTPAICLSYGLRMFIGSNCYISLYNSTRTVNCYSGKSTTDGKWHHVMATYNVITNIIAIYFDGVLANATSYTSGYTYTSSWSNGVFIGRDPNNSTATQGYFYQGDMNDVRIYDECLSAKEIKEIAKGLVVHYKLDNNGCGNSNLVKNSLRTVTNSSYNIANYDLSENLVSGKQYTVTMNGTCGVGKSTGFGVWMGGGYNHLGYFNLKNGDSGTKSFTFTMPSSISGNGRKDAINIYVVASGETATSTINWIKLEEGTRATSWCPNITDTLYSELGFNVEYDCSGYGHNGTKNGTIIPSNNSSKYEVSSNFDGNTNSITIGDFSTIVPEGLFTMNCWIYKDGTWSSKGWETIFGGSSGFELETKNSSTNSPSFYAYSWGKGNCPYELNRWNMITMVRTTSDTKFYLNGELAFTGTVGSIPSATYFVGSWSTATGQNYKGLVSDFRIYSTALSADDIKELYQTSASIANNGDMFCYEFKEV